ncbi:hypothetical protein ABEF95_011389 [Exophiala dermatitidis]
MAVSSEREPLLPYSKRPRPSFFVGSRPLCQYEPVAPPLIYNPSPPRPFWSFSLSFRAKVILVMVVLPAYLLATSALSALGPLNTHDTVIRTPQTEPMPEPSSGEGQPKAPQDPFASIKGPLMDTNFPDPAIIHADGVSYSFATNNRGAGADMVHVQVATSTDNQTWTLLDHYDALPKVATWETGARVWAPDVVQLDDGSFVLYYSGELASSPAFHCVGAATSKDVMGPYVPLERPIACPDVFTRGGAIDPDGYHDPSTGKRYVVYKTDGNSIGHGGSCNNDVAPIVSTPIMLQEVGQDGISIIGDAIQILDRDDIDGPLIEAPSLHRSEEGIYFLFFSSNCFTTPKYDVSYATAPSIKGPYTKSSRPLLVTSDANLVGPGGLDIIKGGNMVVFHGHITTDNDPSHDEKTTNAPLVRGMWSGIATFNGTNVCFN